jgi:hypothetical protein
MKTLAALLLGLAAVGPDPAEETRDVRVYLIDRTTPERDFKDAVAVLTIERPSGRGRTFLLPRADAACDETTGLIRGLPGTPYFVEMNSGDGTPPAKEETKAGEILRRVHQSGCFAGKIPASLVSEPFTATITIRLGNLTFTSEEFQGPRTKSDDLPDAAARVDRSLALLKERAGQLAGFMDLRPAVVELLRDLARLSPAGFEDVTGAFERDRQWCLAQARAIEKACYDGDTTRIVELTQLCGPRLQEMKTTLARTKRPETPPEPEVK